MFRLTPSPRPFLGRGWRVQRLRANKPYRPPKWSCLLGLALCKHPPRWLPPLLPVFFLEVTGASSRSDLRSSSWPAGEEGRSGLPALSPDSGPSAGRRGYKGARRRQGRGPGEERKTPQTLAAAPREALERAGAKHKQTHARPGSDRGSAAPALAAARFKGAARAPPPAPAPPPSSPPSHLAREGPADRAAPVAGGGGCPVRARRFAPGSPAAWPGGGVCGARFAGRTSPGLPGGGGGRGVAEDWAPARDNQLSFSLLSCFPRRRQ